MKVAIVHDYLNQYGGAERVVEVLNELFPDAPIYTSIYIPGNMPESFKNMHIETSFMQKFPFLNKHFKKYLLFYPKSMETFNLNEYDLVISSSSAFAKGVIAGRNTCHICYCYTPARFIWEYDNYVNKEDFGKITSKILPFIIGKLKYWDLKTVSRVNYFIAISENIKNKIKKYYKREAEVIYPPVEVSKFKVSNNTEDFFLIVSRLNAYKNIDLVIKAFNKLHLKLKIIGSGPYRKVLENMKKSKNIEFLGRVEDKELIKIYSKCRAFIFPGEEDFGISPLEAQASGRPVIAYARGGALETIIEGTTGLFFRENSVDSLIEVVNKFMKIENKFDQKVIRKNALRFDKKNFSIKLRKFITQKYNCYVKSVNNCENYNSKVNTNI